MRANIEVTNADRKAVDKFLDTQRGFTEEQYWHSYPQWAKGSESVWGKLHQGGTGIMTALCWYHHRHRPGSKEHRAAVIIRALIKAAHETVKEG